MWNRTYKRLIDEIVSLEAKGNGDFLDYVRQKHAELDLCRIALKRVRIVGKRRHPVGERLRLRTTQLGHLRNARIDPKFAKPRCRYTRKAEMT